MARTTKPEETTSQKQPLTAFAAWSATFAALAGIWQYGFSIGSINAVYGPVTEAIKEHYEYRKGKNVSDAEVQNLWVVISAAFPFGGIIGSLLVGAIAKRFGRMKGMFWCHCFVVLNSLLLGLSNVMKSPEAMIISRIGIGVTSASMGVGLSTMYVLEISPQHKRGLFGGMVGIGVAVAIEVSNILGLQQIFGNRTLWPLLLALTGAPSLCFLVLYSYMPKSPRKLYIEDGDKEGAIIILRRLRGVSDVQNEVEEMETELKSNTSPTQITVLQLIRSPLLRRPLVAVLVLASSFQLTGLNAIAFNTNNILISAGIDSSVVGYISIAIFGVGAIIHLVFAPLIDRYGRKKLLLLGYGIETIALFLLMISVVTQHLVDGMKYLSIIATLGFFFGFSLGPGPITFLIFSEFFEQSSRSTAVTLANFTLWTFFTIVVLITPYMIDGMGGYTFLPYGIIGFLTVVYIYKYVPETKNRSFSEIQQSFSF